MNEGEGLRSHIHAAWGGKDLFQFMDQTIVKGCPRQEPGVRTDTEIIKEHCFLACIPRFTQFAFLYSLGPPALGMAPPTVDWACPHAPFINKMPADIPIGQSDGGNFFFEGLFTDDPSYVKLTKTSLCTEALTVAEK